MHNRDKLWGRGKDYYAYWHSLLSILEFQIKPSRHNKESVVNSITMYSESQKVEFTALLLWHNESYFSASFLCLRTLRTIIKAIVAFFIAKKKKWFVGQSGSTQGKLLLFWQLYSYPYTVSFWLFWLGFSNGCITKWYFGYVWSDLLVGNFLGPLALTFERKCMKWWLWISRHMQMS